VNDVIVTLHCVSCRVGSLQLFILVMGLLKIFQQNLHIYHRNDSISLCTIHFIYILVLEDVIGSDVGGQFLLAHPVYIFIIESYTKYRHAYRLHTHIRKDTKQK